jgi:signal transduction histidine kinase
MPTDSISRPRALLVFEVAVISLALLAIAVLFRLEPSAFEWLLLLWSVLIAVVEFMPVQAWRGMTISVGFPLLVAVAILYPPGIAGLITFLGMADPRELRREVRPTTALFNRSQVALSVMAASSVFHLLADVHSSRPLLLVVAASLASVADYVANTGLVTVYMTFRSGVAPTSVLRELRVGDPRGFLVSYLGLGLLGLTLAKLHVANRGWEIPAYLAPLLFARLAFFRARALEEAHKELQEREEILRQLSNTMAEERADERLQIAGYLHDDLAQVLFRLSLQVDIARKLLDKEDLDQLQTQLEKIKDSKQETSDRIRALIRDLHRSPLGAKGLSEAIESFTDEVGRDSGVAFHRDIADIALPAPIALLLYHVTREGVMNALKHAHATDMWMAVREEDDQIVLELSDNGVGFDTSAPGPEGHFGMAMMRERAKVGGGTLDVASGPDDGTTITVRFPIALLQRDQESGNGPASASSQAHASLGTPGTTTPTAEGSRGAVPA